MRGTNSSSSGGDKGILTLEGLQKIKAKLREKEQELLRRESLLVENMVCSSCGRKVTVTGTGFQKTYVVCPHMWDALKKRCEIAKPEEQAIQGYSPIESPLHAVRIEVFDDGPSRW